MRVDVEKVRNAPTLLSNLRRSSPSAGVKNPKNCHYPLRCRGDGLGRLLV